MKKFFVFFILITVSNLFALPIGALDFLKREEGLRLQAYSDRGRYSIGYGSLSYEGEVITIQEAERRLECELKKAESAFVKYFGQKYISLSDNQKTALLSLRYNVGSLSGFPKLRKAILEGRLNDACREINTLQNKKRRARERALWNKK